MSFDKLLVARAIRKKHACLKFFYMDSRIPLAELGIMQLYEHHSLTADELAYDLFAVIRRLSGFHNRAAQFINGIKEMYESTPMEMTFRELFEQTIVFLGLIRSDLLEFDVYDGDRLPFNTMWFEKPDTIALFKMEQSDV